MEEKYRNIIAHEFEDCVSRTIVRLQNEETNRPFHTALLSPEVLFWSRFERSFSTSFGQSVIERISKVAAMAGGATQAETQKESVFNLSSSRMAAIDAHISALRNKKTRVPSLWDDDMNALLALADENFPISVRVISDLWWVKDGVNNYMSIKTVKPNIDQTAEAKRDLLKLKINDPSCNVYFGLYYNPFGEVREDYSWSPALGIFNFALDPVVLVGRDYWDTLGGAGFYEEVVAIAQECGTRTKSIVENLYK